MVAVTGHVQRAATSSARFRGLKPVAWGRAHRSNSRSEAERRAGVQKAQRRLRGRACMRAEVRVRGDTGAEYIDDHRNASLVESWDLTIP